MFRPIFGGWKTSPFPALCSGTNFFFLRFHSGHWLLPLAVQPSAAKSSGLAQVQSAATSTQDFIISVAINAMAFYKLIFSSAVTAL